MRKNSISIWMIVQRLCFSLLVMLGILGNRELLSAQSPITVSGTVVEGETRQPLEGVKLFIAGLSKSPNGRLISPTDFPFIGITDDTGHFTVQVPQPGRYLLLPTKDHFVYPRANAGDADGAWVEIAGGGVVPEITIAMVREASVTGRVYDPNGRPATGTPVSLLQYIYGDDGQRALIDAGKNTLGIRTDDRGEYRFWGLSPGEYVIRAYPESPLGRWMAVYYPGSSDKAHSEVVTIKSGEDLSVNAMSLIERETVPVTLRFPDSSALGGWNQRAVHFAGGGSFTSTANGKEIVLQLARGTHKVMVNWGTPNGPQSYSDQIDIEAEAPLIKDIVPTPLIGLNIDLSVLGIDGDSTALQIRCYLQSDFQFIPVACRGESKVPVGTYRLKIESLPADAYVESAMTPETDILLHRVELKTDAVINLVLKTPGGLIRGFVTTPAGERLPRATVVVIPPVPLRGTDTHYRSVTSDINGHFELRGIAPGTYELFAWKNIQGAAYRNSAFLESFAGQGKVIRIVTDEAIGVDIVGF